MAMAPVAYCLWQRFLRFDPNQPIRPNRDRFVLSAGNAPLLLYLMLHLTGMKAVNPKYETLGHRSVTLEDIKRFRQLDSKMRRPPGNTGGLWVSKQPPARWDKAWPPVSGWRLPPVGSRVPSIARATNY